MSCATISSSKSTKTLREACHLKRRDTPPCVHWGDDANRTAVPRRPRQKRHRRLASGFALWIPTDAPQPRLLCTGNSVPYLGDRRECRGVQLGRRDLIPSLSRCRAPRAAVCPWGSDPGNEWGERPV